MKSIILAQTVITSMMHGVAYFSLPLSPRNGNACTAIYTDSTQETADIGPELAKQVRAAHTWQNGGKGPEVEAPSGFSLVSAIQAKRKVLETA